MVLNPAMNPSTIKWQMFKIPPTLQREYIEWCNQWKPQLIKNLPGVNMKIVLALSCLSAMASALPYPMAFPPMPYEEVDAVQRYPRQGGDDQVYAADSSYGAAPVS